MRPPPAAVPRSGLAAEFETVYRENVPLITACFARRTTDPQVAADLTSDTFVRAAGALGTTPGAVRVRLFRARTALRALSTTPTSTTGTNGDPS